MHIDKNIYFEFKAKAWEEKLVYEETWKNSKSGIHT